MTKEELTQVLDQIGRVQDELGCGSILSLQMEIPALCQTRDRLEKAYLEATDESLKSKINALRVLTQWCIERCSQRMSDKN